MDERREIAKRVMRAMRHESARRPLLNDQIVICVATDTIAYASEQVSAAGGAATVVVPSANGGLVPLGWVNREPVEHLEVQVDQRVHPDSELSMLLEFMETTGTDSLSIRIEESELVVTEAEPLHVPA